MATKRKGLGTGLDALLSSEARRNPAQASEKAAENNTGLKEIAIDLMDRGEMQPRVDMREDALQDLADSIKSQGLAQPILVRPKPGGRFEIVAGERRWRAAQLAGLQQIPAVIRDLDDTKATALALIENMQREDLNPMEESRGLFKLKQQTECTHQELATMVGKSRTTITNLMRLMELEVDVQKLLESRAIEMGHARALLGLSGKAQKRAAKEVVAKGLSVRATERLVKAQSAPKPAKKKAKTVDADVRRLENTLSQRLGAKVAIQQSGGGKGKLVIAYNSLDELDGILAHIK